MGTEERERRFGFWTGLYVVISCMVGAGILTSSGFTLKATGNAWSLLGLWTVGGLMALCGAVVLTELSTRMPRVGGDYVFVKEAFGPGAGFVVGWATFVIGFAGPTAVIALLSAKYLVSSIAGYNQWVITDVQEGNYAAGLASTMIVVIMSVHCLGYKESTWMQSLMTIIKILILGMMIVCGMMSGAGDWNHFGEGGWPKSEEWPKLATSLIYVGYAYSGWNAAAYLAGEIKSPEKLLARSMIGGTLFVMVVYLLMNVVYVYALSPREMMGLSFGEVEKVAELAMVKLFGWEYGYFIGGVLGLSLVSSVSGYLLTGPRVSMVMARDGMFVPFLGDRKEGVEVPIRGTICQGLLAVVMIWSGSFLELLNYMSAGLALISGLVVSSLIRIRGKSTELKIYRVPLYPWPVVIYLGLVCWTLVYAISDEKTKMATILSMLTVAVGVPVGWLVGKGKKREM